MKACCKNLEDCRRGLVGDYVYPDIACEFVDEDNEVQTVAEGFWRDVAEVGINALELPFDSRVCVCREWLQGLFRHYANLAIARLV